MGGKIWVESTEGKGSKFTFTIKAELAEPEDESKRLTNIEKRITDITSVTKPKVLLVENNKTQEEALRKMVQGLGVACVSYSSVLEARREGKGSEGYFAIIVDDELEREEVEGLLNKHKEAQFIFCEKLTPGAPSKTSSFSR